VKPKLIAAAVAAALAFGLALTWAPTAGRRAHALGNQAERAIAHRDIQVSPAELATLMHNRQVALALFDLRYESAFNQAILSLDRTPVAPVMYCCSPFIGPCSLK
jgi:hypothetical protein